MKMRNLAVILPMAVITAFLAMGCGGSGSGESVNYTGDTQPAVIDTTTAVDLAMNSILLMDSDPTGGSIPLGLQGGSYSSQLSNPDTAIDLAKSYMSGGGAGQSLAVGAEPLVMMCDSDVIDTGSVSGEIWVEICIDMDDPSDTQYWVKIEMDFRNYDDGSEYIDGALVVQGIFDEIEEDLVDDIRVIFRDLLTQSSTEDFYMDGWVDYEELAGVYSIVYNLFIIDSMANDAVWMDNYAFVMNDNDDTVTINGRLYDADDGYVEIATLTPLSWAMHTDTVEGLVFDDEYPTGGVIRLTGANGAWIEIEFRDNGGTPEFRVTVDVDNDPADIPLWEWQSAWLTWD
jgi:hypothetical protein